VSPAHCRAAPARWRASGARLRTVRLAAGQGIADPDADVRERQAAHVVDITITLPGEVENP
jgi:hypothetical protein